MEVIYVSGMKVIITRKNIKKIYVRITDSDHVLQVNSPFDVSHNQISELICSKLDLIKKKQQNHRLSRGPLDLAEWNQAQKKDAAEYLQKEVPVYLDKWQKIMGISVQKVQIKLMKTRWGSCTPGKRRISLNLALAKKDPEFLEYIIVHELVHFFETGHNRKFYSLMDFYLPKWKIIKKKNKYSD